MHGRIFLVGAVFGMLACGISVALGGSCITSSGAAGSCVTVQVCPRLKTIRSKSFVTRQDIDYLIAAYNACPGELFCCGNSVAKIVLPTTTVPPVEAGGYCLQNWLDDGADFVGASSPSSSFGVFIAIGKRKTTRCVGSLITPEFVLTAAHCAPDDDVSNYALYVSARHVVKDKVAGVQVDVEPHFVREIIIHEQYRDSDNVHDLALLRLNETVPSGDGSMPPLVCIPMGPDLDAVASVGQTLQCFGWGFNAEGRLSSSKQWVTLERVSLEYCQERIGQVQTRQQVPVAVTERNICTITITGHDAYAGYSGGPLMYQKDGRWHLIGVISYGVGAINNKFPVVSTNVQQYTSWILNKIRRQN